MSEREINKIRLSCGILDMICTDCDEDCPEAGCRKGGSSQAKPGAEPKPGLKKWWEGSWPAKCQVCSTALIDQPNFVKGKTKHGPWVLMCPICHAVYGTGLGFGRGQKYDSETLEKVEG